MIIPKEQALQFLSDLRKELIAFKVTENLKFIDDSIAQITKEETKELNMIFIVMHLMKLYSDDMIKVWADRMKIETDRLQGLILEKGSVKGARDS